MRLPKMTELPISRDMIDIFGGYNHNLRINENEFFNMKNLTSTDYPVLSQRPQRGTLLQSVTPSESAIKGMIYKNQLCYIDEDTDIVIGDNRISMGLTVDDNVKTLVSMGAYIIIFPDKKYINTLDITDRGSLEADVTTTGTISVVLCDEKGRTYRSDETQSTDIPMYQPREIEGNLWLDTDDNTIKQYSAETGKWNAVPTYIKVASTGIGTQFSAGDAITFDDYGGDLSDEIAQFLIGEKFYIVGKDNDYIYFSGIVPYETENEADGWIRVSRKIPNMDFVIESNNRLWGCRYGEDINGNFVNEIYASKLGDFKNWNSFQGISTDSYVASVGTDGKFTGAISHLGYPIFFKENHIYKIYGSYPSNYQIQSTACRGVQEGCSKSLAIVNEVLYYKSRNAICAYDGSLPVEISSALGDVSYSDAVGGTFGNKYYISMKDEDAKYHLFALDVKKGLWHREDNTQIKEFCTGVSDLYYIDDSRDSIKTIYGSGIKDEKPINWYAESGIMGISLPDKKYISRLDIRMKPEIGAAVSIYIEYDSDGMWDHIQTITGMSLKSFAIPIKPRRCDHLRIKFSGVGYTKIFSITKTISQGSDQ